MREGWIKSHRKITDSAIWSMAPLYLKVWQHLLHAACFEEKNIPMKDGSFIKLEKGQHLTSIRIIADKVSWYERGLEKSPNPKTISEILEWMITQNMIQIDNGKNDKQYSLISIVNWNYYQTGNEADGNNEHTESTQSPGIKNNYNNSKKEKEEKMKEEQKEIPTPLCSSPSACGCIGISETINTSVGVGVGERSHVSEDSMGSAETTSNIGKGQKSKSGLTSYMSQGSMVNIGTSMSMSMSTSTSNITNTNACPIENAYESITESTPAQNIMKEFNEFWNKYPRKHDKNNAYKCFIEKLSSGAKASDLIAAASGYNNYCSSNNIGMVYIKYPCNFLSEDQYWEEYIGYTRLSNKSSIYPPNAGKRIYSEYDFESLLMRG